MFKQNYFTRIARLSGTNGKKTSAALNASVKMYWNLLSYTMVGDVPGAKKRVNETLMSAAILAILQATLILSPSHRRNIHLDVNCPGRYAKQNHQPSQRYETRQPSLT